MRKAVVVVPDFVRFHRAEEIGEGMGMDIRLSCLGCEAR